MKPVSVVIVSAAVADFAAIHSGVIRSAVIRNAGIHFVVIDSAKRQLMIKFLLVMLSAISFGGGNHLAAQSKYTSSIRDHRYMYKRDLVAIIKEDTSQVDFYDADPGYRLQAVFTPASNEPVFNMGTSSGKSKKARKTGTVEFKLDGKSYKLAAFQLMDLLTDAEYRDYFFIPFTDGTSSSETYGGGRYLDFRTGNIKKGRSLIIDFNKAYNPSCAFADGYSCPIPPSENQLEVAIRAGEKNFLKKTGKPH